MNMNILTRIILQYVILVFKSLSVFGWKCGCFHSQLDKNMAYLSGLVLLRYLQYVSRQEKKQKLTFFFPYLTSLWRYEAWNQFGKFKMRYENKWHVNISLKDRLTLCLKPKPKDCQEKCIYSSAGQKPLVWAAALGQSNTHCVIHLSIVPLSVGSLRPWPFIETGESS